MLRTRFVTLLSTSLLSFFLFLPSGFSAKIISIDRNGELRLENGERVRLAGLELPSETLPILRILLAGQEVRIEKEKGKEGESVPPVYLFVSARILNLPFLAGDNPAEKEILLNQFLLSLGAARVAPLAQFSKRKTFLEIEARARTAGKGIWSYEKEPFEATFSETIFKASATTPEVIPEAAKEGRE